MNGSLKHLPAAGPSDCCDHALEECCSSSPGPVQGELLRDAGFHRVEAGEDPRWVEAADRAIRDLAASGNPFTAEDVRRRAGSPRRPNSMGARISHWATKGLIRPAGYVRAKRSSRRASRLGRWVGAKEKAS